MHFLDALKHKHRAVERAEVFSNARFPQPLRQLLKRFVRRDRDTAGKQFMRVMELLETHRLSDIVKAVVSAAELGVDDPAAIALLLIQTTPTASTPLATESLPDAAKITPPQPRLDAAHDNCLWFRRACIKAQDRRDQECHSQRVHAVTLSFAALSGFFFD
jgi:hypothetical protein